MNIKIRYELNLKELPERDWRRSLEYYIFPGTYEEMCWYPDFYVKNNRDFTKNFEVRLTYPSNFVIQNSGFQIVSKTENNRTTSLYTAEEVRYFGLNVSDSFIQNSIEGEDISVSYFCSKEQEDTYANIAAYTLEAIEWYKKVYGFFPKKYIGINSGNTNWTGGFPSENMFYVHGGKLDEKFLRWITAHELGHYYWGLNTFSATADELSAILLSNGIWADHLYLSQQIDASLEETWNTHASEAAYMEKYLASLLANHEQKVGLLKKESKSLYFDYNSNIRHAKAAVGIYLFSREIGYDKFLEIQKEILSTFNKKPFSFLDFTELVKTKGYDTVFIEDWFKDNSIIEYKIQKFSENVIEGKWNYNFQLVNMGSLDYPIEIEIEDVKGKIYNLKSKANAKKEDFSIVFNNSLKHIKLDPKGAVPMWNSSHIAIQRNYIMGLYRAGHTNIAKKLAKDFLSREPDERLKIIDDRKF